MVGIWASVVGPVAVPAGCLSAACSSRRSWPRIFLMNVPICVGDPARRGGGAPPEVRAAVGSLAAAYSASSGALGSHPCRPSCPRDLVQGPLLELELGCGTDFPCWRAAVLGHRDGELGGRRRGTRTHRSSGTGRRAGLSPWRWSALFPFFIGFACFRVERAPFLGGRMAIQRRRKPGWRSRRSAAMSGGVRG